MHNFTIATLLLAVVIIGTMATQILQDAHNAREERRRVDKYAVAAAVLRAAETILRLLTQ